MGDIPAKPSELQLIAPFATFLAVSINDTFLGKTRDSVNPNLWSVDVSGYAGQTVELAFRARNGWGIFDVLGFKTIPEPSSLALFGLGAAVLFVTVERRRKPVMQQQRDAVQLSRRGQSRIMTTLLRRSNLAVARNLRLG